MSARSDSSRRDSEVCPTCGETGPDVLDPAGDYGDDYEARCGDTWHDDQPSLADDLATINAAASNIDPSIDVLAEIMKAPSATDVGPDDA